MSNVCVASIRQCSTSATKGITGLTSKCEISGRNISRWLCLQHPHSSTRFQSSWSLCTKLQHTANEPQDCSQSRWRGGKGSAFESRRCFQTQQGLMKKLGPRDTRPSKPPASYRPPPVRYPFGNLPKERLAKIFEQDVTYEEGNKLLQTIHERRVRGSLIDKGLQLDKTDVPVKSLTKALQWLRKEHPIDEKGAAQQWANQEAGRLEESYIADAQRLGLYKKGTTTETSATNTNISVIDQFKKHHEERRAREKKEKEKSGEAQKEQQLAIARRDERDQEISQINERIALRREERAKKGQASNMEELPELSIAQILFRPMLFGFSLLAAIYLLSETYVPPEQSQRLFSSAPVAITTLGTLTAMHVLVWVAWRVPPLWKKLNTYFVLVQRYPYTLSLFLNNFSHQGFLHLLNNLAGLWLFGLPLHEDLGRAHLLQLYLSGFITGSMFSLVWGARARGVITTTLGASAGTYALMSAWAVSWFDKPAKESESFSFVMDVARWVTVIINVPVNLLPSARQMFDLSAHLGGTLSGLVDILWIRLKSTSGQPSDDQKQ